MRIAWLLQCCLAIFQWIEKKKCDTKCDTKPALQNVVDAVARKDWAEESDLMKTISSAEDDAGPKELKLRHAFGKDVSVTVTATTMPSEYISRFYQQVVYMCAGARSR